MFNSSDVFWKCCHHFLNFVVFVAILSRWAMGDAEEVVLFIRECLHMDSVLEVRAHSSHLAD